MVSFKKKIELAGFLLSIIMLSPMLFAADEAIDASDPTRIYSYAGAGLKYSDYTNNESMWELRATGNMGITAQDMVMFEVGYGRHSGNRVQGDNADLTNARARWFHLFEMDYTVESGYRGWATQVDIQVAGALKGTDGQNVLALGVLPAFGLGPNWSFFLPLNLINTWDKNFEHYNGLGLGVSPLLVYVPDNWWSGAYVQFWPNYTRFVAGELTGEGAGNLDLIFGGKITPETWWGAKLHKNVDKDLRSFRRGDNTGLTNDWNAFFNVVTYF